MTASAVSQEHAEAVAPGRGDVLAHATHYRYEVTKRGPEAVEDAYIGLFLDPDLGDPSDDYVGSDRSLRMVYAYNDSYDGYPGGPSEWTYGDSPPALGVMVRSEPQADGTFLTFLAGAGAGPIGRPQSAEESYALLRGHHYTADGLVPWTISPNGVSGTEPTTATYSGRPPDGWSMLNTDGQGGTRPPDSYNMLASQGPFRLGDGDTVVLEATYVWTRSDEGHLASVRQLVDSAAPAARALPLAPPVNLATILPGQRPVETTAGPDAPELRVVAAPNPQTSAGGGLRMRFSEAVALRLRVVDLLGRVVRDEDVEAGAGVSTIPVTSLVPGLYVYVVTGATEAGQALEATGTFSVVR